MIIYIDIDNTICSVSDLLDYSMAKPIMKNISAANYLYDMGHTIIYWTGRGRDSGIDWIAVTKKQLLEWGVKYHDLKFNKPYDLIIDDKAINSKDFSNNIKGIIDNEENK